VEEAGLEVGRVERRSSDWPKRRKGRSKAQVQSSVSKQRGKDGRPGRTLIFLSPQQPSTSSILLPSAPLHFVPSRRLLLSRRGRPICSGAALAHSLLPLRGPPKAKSNERICGRGVRIESGLDRWSDGGYLEQGDEKKNEVGAVSKDEVEWKLP
jgi:hypothetical protein